MARLVREVVSSKKPLAAICIAPALISRILGDDKLVHKLTIGTDEGTAEALEKMGTNHVDCSVNNYIIDPANKLISTPAYMLAGNIREAADGIEKTVAELLKMI